MRLIFLFSFIIICKAEAYTYGGPGNCILLFRDSIKVTKELKQIRAEDQTYRTRYYLSYRDSFQYLKDSIDALQEIIDRKNHQRLVVLIDKYGYNCLATKYYNRFLASVFSHMPDDLLKYYYEPKVLEAVKAKLQPPLDYASLVDWRYFRMGDNQVYGTFQCGHKVLCPMQNKKKVNEMRAEIGLESIEEWCRKNNFTIP